MFLSPSKGTAARPEQEHPQYLQVPNASFSGSSSQQSSRSNSPHHSLASQYSDNSASGNPRCPSPLEHYIYNQNVQALQDLDVNNNRYDQMQPSLMSNAQQYPQQFQSTPHASYPPDNTSNYNDQNTFYPPTAPTNSSFGPRQMPRMVNPQQYPQQYRTVVQTSFPANHTLNYNDEATTQSPLAPTLSVPQVNSFYLQPSQQNYSPDLDLAGPESWFAATAPQPALNQHLGNTFFGQGNKGDQSYEPVSGNYAPTGHMLPSIDVTSRRGQMIPQDSNSPGRFDSQRYLIEEGMETNPLSLPGENKELDDYLQLLGDKIGRSTE